MGHILEVKIMKLGSFASLNSLSSFFAFLWWHLFSVLFYTNLCAAFIHLREVFPLTPSPSQRLCIPNCVPYILKGKKFVFLWSDVTLCSTHFTIYTCIRPSQCTPETDTIQCSMSTVSIFLKKMGCQDVNEKPLTFVTLCLCLLKNFVIFLLSANE